MRNGAMEFDAASLTPKFRLKVGEPGRSRAFEIARRILPEGDFLERAERYRSPLLVRLDQLTGKLDSERELVERERAALDRDREALREAVERRHREADRLRQRLERMRGERQDALGRLYQEAQEYVRGLRESLEARAREAQPAEALAETRQAERQLSERSHAASVRRKRRETPGRPLPPEDLRAGVQAWLHDLAAVVTIVRLGEGKAWVEWQGRRVEVPVGALEQVPSGQAPRMAAPRSWVRPEEPAGEPVGRDLDLRGCHVEEALERLDRYLDRASMQRLHQVRIVHGKGTGVLKREIERHLQDHPLVTQYRMGELGEGGWGVTVAELGTT